MRYRTLEIRWHDSKPISTCDFQPVPFKKARPSPEKGFAGQSYKLATGGEDNHVRIWLVHPNITPETGSASDPNSTTTPIQRPPRVEYLATLSRHSAAVNVARFSPNGELIASAGDDGMIIIWAPSNTPQVSTYGSDLSVEDLQYEKEHWKPRITFRCTTMQVYDLAWSPSGEYILAGSTDNCARVYTAIDGKCVHEIAEHTHYVQGVAWDPLNEYIATQSSDRSMHIYRISTKGGTFEAHAVGKNTRMIHHHTRTPKSQSHSEHKPRMFRSESTASDAESNISEHEVYPPSSSGGIHGSIVAPLTPATSVASTPSSYMFPPPPMEKSSSRRSSFSGSNAPSSPSHYGRFGRSPSPMPALPAIRSLPSAAATWASVKLYGDESFTNFFRRLTFSPDGGLLLTPAGQFEDPAVIPGSSRSSSTKGDDPPAHGRKKGLSISTTSDVTDPSSASSVYIYSRANFARPPIGQLPGHKKASVAVRFSPVLYELRQGVIGGGLGAGGVLSGECAPTRSGVLDRGGGSMDIDIAGPVASSSHDAPTAMPTSKPPHPTPAPIAAPAPILPGSRTAPSPVLSPTDRLRPSTPATSNPATPVPHASVFALPYRMLFAVVTMDTVAIYDTQQAGPVCMLTKLHYDEFTDMAWSPDGQCLILSSRDGYCTIVIFDEILTPFHTQQQTLQLQSIAHHHSVPITYANPTPMPTPSSSSASLPHTTPPNVHMAKRRVSGGASSSSLVGAGEEFGQGRLSGSGSGRKSVGGDVAPAASSLTRGRKEQDEEEVGDDEEEPKVREPPKKKRRVVLTKVGDIDDADGR